MQPNELTTAGSTMGTVSYMSPEQARGQLTDARTDLFSLGTVLYQAATGVLPFPGETSAVVFDAILNRAPLPVGQARTGLPADLDRILGKALEKERSLRYQSATDLKTDLLRLKRDLESGGRRAAELSESRGGAAKPAEKSVAVLYFGNLSGVKEDEYLRDGVTEDIIAELSKIKGLRIFARSTVLAFRDKEVTPAQVGQQLGAAFLLTGSLRRAGSRLRINAELVDTKTDFPLWSERYDREMKDVFEVQDEIARSIAEALRVTLSPQEQAALAARPTDNLQAYDLYLRGKSFARRVTRQDTEFALQMFESAVSMDPGFALAHAAIANACAQYFYRSERDPAWIDRAKAASERASALGSDAPEIQVAEAWILYAESNLDEATRRVRRAIERKPDCEGAYYLLGRVLFADGKYQEIADMAEAAMAAAGADYNVYIPIGNAMGALGKKEATESVRQREMLALENHLRTVPEDARAHVLLAADYAQLGRVEDALRETSLAMALRSNETTVLYNAACVYCQLGPEARRPAGAPPGLAGRLQGRRLGAPRPRPRPPPRGPGVREAVPRRGGRSELRRRAADDRSDGLALPGHVQARQRGHGRRVRGRGHEARPPRRAQVPARGDGAGHGLARALPARGARGLRPQPPRDLHGLRDRPARGPALHRDGAAGGRDARRADPAAGLSTSGRSSTSGSRSRTRSSRPTPRGSCTGTSSRPTSSSTPGARPRSWTSVSPRSSVLGRAGGAEHSEAPTAVQPNELTTAGSTMGTVSYMSPEQARGQVTDARTDLFSLGTVLYQAATGALPFQGETSAVVFEAILNREPAPITQANPALPGGAQPHPRQGAREGPGPALPDRHRPQDRPDAPQARHRLRRPAGGGALRLAALPARRPPRSRSPCSTSRTSPG